MNPGIAPSGLFWTTRIPSRNVWANPAEGRAVLEAHDLHVLDFGNFGNALGGGPSVPAKVSFEVRWSGVDDRVNIRDRSNGFAGEFVRDTDNPQAAQMEWSAIVGDFAFVSAPLSTSSSAFAELGKERNGSFFPRH
jgi:hypothetical protein